MTHKVKQAKSFSWCVITFYVKIKGILEGVNFLEIDFFFEYRS